MSAELKELFHDGLTRQLLIDADEKEACGAGNEAANMRSLVDRCLEMRRALVTRNQVSEDAVEAVIAVVRKHDEVHDRGEMQELVRDRAEAHLRASVAAALLKPDTSDDLRAKLRNIISHASGGHLSAPEDMGRSLNDICVEISRHHNRIWEHAQETALKAKPDTSELVEALKARLASLYAKGNTIPVSRTEAQRIVAALTATKAETR